MASRLAQRKDEAIGEAGRIARRTLPGAAGESAERFLAQFYVGVAPEDVAELSAEALTGSALALWRFLQSRPLQTAKIRAYNPRIADHGWTCGHTVVEIVNDDMPFLVDSVTGWLTQKGIGLHQLIHPVLRVERDAKGELTALLPAGSTAGQSESVMHLEIDSQGGAADLAQIERGLGAALADVRAAVEDWPAMRQRAAAILEEMAKTPPGVSEDEAAEARHFLGWLDANHFTYLGYREYAFGGDAAEPALGRVVEGSGLGLLREPETAIFHPTTEASALPPDMRALVRSPTMVMIAKANKRSTVHRPVHFDTVGIKKYDGKGKVVGEYRFIGLFTSDIYNLSPRLIPLLRRKVAHVLTRSKLPLASHDGKALMHILETYPRDELFQIGEQELTEISLGILRLQDRARVALFIRRDPFERFLSCLVYAPRDRFDTELRLAFQDILCRELNGTVSAFYTQIGDSPLARLHVIIKTTPGAVPDYDSADIEAKLARAMRAWRDDLRAALVSAHGEDAGLDLLKRYGDAFPTAYRESAGADFAVGDIAKVETALGGQSLGLNLYRPIGAADEMVRFKVYNAGEAVPLSDVLPMLENMGFKVIDEQPYRVAPAPVVGRGGDSVVWIHDFGMISRGGVPVALEALKPLFETAFARLWAGEMEDDGFNRLVLLAGLDWREVTMVRAIAKYLRQAGIPFSQAYMETTFAGNPLFARRLADLFAARFDPANRHLAESREVTLKVAYEDALDGVASLDEDRILRRFLNVLLAMLRSNFYQRDANGDAKSYLSFKLDSRMVDDLPLPCPLFEVFVYSPRMEGIHLRGGKVARGGIRWSDRREDFRTEILGLMKAQMVKNAVIVPVGAKGGFVLKKLPAGAGRDETMAEGIGCYTLLMKGLLDITDNRVGTAIVAPKDVVRQDGDDPYLVVAADKGTASFSDLANGIARDYGFWLDDAFASGGSAGYDHKKMGITARGTWESVKRHFREIGVDSQSQDFTVVGVGDMSGDVFGNGMLLSPHIKLLAAFNHLHIFVDPNPDPAASLAERQRLFALPRSSWSNYDAKLISKGGGVFDRKAKSIKLTPEIRALFDIKQEALAPNELIRMLLKAEADLLFFGGIGTFVKAATESHAEASDRANDSTRIDGHELRAKVVGEGANLGMTQLGRIEYAKFGGPRPAADPDARAGAGGRLNTDAVDNSAGVDASDHEVNIKILTGAVVAEGDLTLKQRDRLLVEMTDELAGLILRDNYLQTQAISTMEAQGPALLDSQVRLIQDLEKAGKLNREVEKLPNDAALAALGATGKGLTRPELSVLLAYGKMTLYETLLDSDLPDETFLVEDLHRYFPTALRERFGEAIARHRLHREIIATVMTNSMVNRVGPTFVNDLRTRTGCSEADIARAYTVTRDAFALRDFWTAVEALDAKAPARLQTEMIIASSRLVERATLWFLQNRGQSIDVAAAMTSVAPAIAALKAALPEALPPTARERFDAAASAYAKDGAPVALAAEAAKLPALAGAADIVKLASEDPARTVPAATVYYAVGDRLALDWLRASAQAVVAKTSWEKQAIAAIVDELFAFQAELAARVLASDLASDDWLKARGPAYLRAQQIIGEMQMAAAAIGGVRKDGGPSPAGVDLAMLAVANRQLRALIAA